MCGVAILAKSIVADYCSYCNRREDRIMPETVFLFCHHCIRKTARQAITHYHQSSCRPEPVTAKQGLLSSTLVTLV